jgi:hypothetical protein
VSDSGYELVRCSRAMVDQLVDRESEPVVVIALKRLDDGTCEMWLRASDVAAEVERLREALREIAASGDDASDWTRFAREALEAGER